MSNSNLIRRVKVAVPLLVVAIGALLHPVTWAILTLGLGVLAAAEIVVTYRGSGRSRQARNYATLLFIITLWGMASMCVVRVDDNGVEGILIIALAVMACDTFALLVGSRWGRTPFFQSISPNKTWEGAIGGWSGSVLMVAVAAAVIDKWFTDLNYLVVCIIGVCAPVLAIAGDLLESKTKRVIDTKDFKLLPNRPPILGAHGGVADRIDALSFTFLILAPAVAALG